MCDSKLALLSLGDVFATSSCLHIFFLSKYRTEKSVDLLVFDQEGKARLECKLHTVDRR